MSRSESIKSLAAALSKAQGEFPLIPKKRTAKMGTYTYKYADLSEILQAVSPILSSNGLSVTQAPTVHLEKLCLQTTLMHESGEWSESFYPLGTYERPQEMGSEITYARRYTLTSVLGIQADEDDDGTLAQQSSVPQAKTKPIIATATDEDPGDFVPSFGKYKDQALRSVDIYDLSSYVAYIEKKAIEDGKPIQGKVLAFMTAATKFIGSRMAKEHGNGKAGEALGF